MYDNDMTTISTKFKNLLNTKNLLKLSIEEVHENEMHVYF